MIDMRLKEVDGDEDENEFVLRPYGLLLLKLNNEAVAQLACDVLAEHMRKHKQAIHVEDDGLYFSDGLDDEDHAVLTRAILWHDLADAEGDIGKEAIQNLHDACQAARQRTWRRRREVIESD